MQASGDCGVALAGIAEQAARQVVVSPHVLLEIVFCAPPTENS